MARIFYSTYSEDCLGRCEQMQVSDQPFTVHLVDGIFQISGHKDVVALNLEFLKHPSSFLVSQPPTRAENAHGLIHVLGKAACCLTISVDTRLLYSPF